MEKLYELTVLLHPDLEIDLAKPLAKVEKIISDNGGVIAKKDEWGKKRLAYPIVKQDFAVYVYYEVAVAPQSANKIQNLLNITDEVVRYLMVEKDIKGEEAAKNRKKAAEAAGAPTESDEDKS
jgi:small subunit ribosomal protein S6